MHNLTALKVKHAKAGDRLTDGGGLRLDVDRAGRASWVFRYTSPVTGSERYMGLGSASDIGLSKARELAADARELVRQHRDPIEERRSNPYLDATRLRRICRRIPWSSPRLLGRPEP